LETLNQAEGKILVFHRQTSQVHPVAPSHPR
jgi:hypothetical protein